ncbi:MAG: excinuclease ABC subunit A [Marinosulfonomonas sp.]|nr:excinuclease ABC subunit A [Marinosulfonomonas sp.]
MARSHKSEAVRGQGVGVGGCPPGLAKKNPPCVPPGQVRSHGYRIGDLFDILRHDRLKDPWNYGLFGSGLYYRFGNEFIRVDPETFIILEVLKLLN